MAPPYGGTNPVSHRLSGAGNARTGRGSIASAGQGDRQFCRHARVDRCSQGQIFCQVFGKPPCVAFFGVMNKTNVVVAVSLSLLAMSGGVAQAAAADSAGILANPSCVELRNGRLCISITPVNQQGSVRVSYVKRSGTPVYGHLEWVNPANQTFKSPDIWMFYLPPTP
jgi:hypothetical protein